VDVKAEFSWVLFAIFVSWFSLLLIPFYAQALCRGMIDLSNGLDCDVWLTRMLSKLVMKSKEFSPLVFYLFYLATSCWGTSQTVQERVLSLLKVLWNLVLQEVYFDLLFVGILDLLLNIITKKHPSFDFLYYWLGHVKRWVPKISKEYYDLKQPVFLRLLTTSFKIFLRIFVFFSLHTQSLRMEATKRIWYRCLYCFKLCCGKFRANWVLKVNGVTAGLRLIFMASNPAQDVWDNLEHPKHSALFVLSIPP
jgi:hypothetical protein